MRRVELTVPLALPEDLAILSARFFRHNPAVEPSKAGPRAAKAVLLASEAALPRLREVLDGLGARYAVRSVLSAPATTLRPLAALTARQRDFLALAHRLGYYESPAKVSLERIAGLVGVSKQALSKHLRVAERKVLATALRNA